MKSDRDGVRRSAFPLPAVETGTPGFVGIIGGLAGLFGFLLLLRSLALGGGWRDVTEFQWATAVLGIPHPPGSPVYMLFANLATYLPFGSIAWRINLLSAFSGAAALVATHRIAWHLLGLAAPRMNTMARALMAVTGPLLLLSSPVFRLHSTTTEVYAPQTLGVGLLAIGLLHWEATRPRDPRPWLIAIFLCAVASGVHVSFVFYLPPVILMGLAISPITRTPRVAALAATSIVLGAAVFLYVPLRAAQAPSINWGNPVTLERTYFHLLNKKDSGLSQQTSSKQAELHAPGPSIAAASIVGSSAAWARRLHQYLSGELGLAAAWSGLIGLAGVAVMRRSAAAAALFGIGGFHALFAIGLGKWASPTGYTPIYLLVAAAAAIPAAVLSERISRRPAIHGMIALAAVALALPPVLLSMHDEEARADRGPDELARELLDEVEPRGILLAAHYWPIVSYLREIEGYRTDVDILFRNQVYESQRMSIDPARYPALRLPPALPFQPSPAHRLRRMAEFLAINHQAGRRISWQSESDDVYFSEIAPNGILFAYRPGDAEPSELAERRIDSWLTSFEPGGARTHWLVGEFGLEEALIPAARFATWQARNGQCESAARKMDRLAAIVPPGVDFRPGRVLAQATQECVHGQEAPADSGAPPARRDSDDTEPPPTSP